MRNLLRPALFVMLILQSTALSVQISDIRHSVSSEKVRIVIEADNFIDYEKTLNGNDIIISFPGTKIMDKLQGYKVLDGMFKDFYINSKKDSTDIFIETGYPVNPKIISLSNPYRIVVDLPRNENTGTVNEENNVGNDPGLVWKNSKPIADGLSYIRVKHPSSGFISHAIIADPAKIDMKPAIAVPIINKKEDNKGVFGSVFSLFSDSTTQNVPNYHFQKQKVSTYVRQHGALAGINGSFFFKDGTPVGVLVIDDQIISSPLYNRTALIFYKNGTAKIDSVQMEGYLKIQSEETVSFNGVNQPLTKDGIIVYTPDYQMTDPANAAVNFTVVNDKVTEITYSETRIPRNGIIISANGTAAESLKDSLKIGDEVKWFFLTSPPLIDIDHIIAGGPRLVKDGKEFVTSDKERFKNDVAKSSVARTAVGITKAGYLIFAVIEGSGKASGATLEELADMMIKLGANDAMNLDGGGSSSMVVNNIKLNIGAERAVSNAIVLKKKDPQPSGDTL